VRPTFLSVGEQEYEVGRGKMRWKTVVSYGFGNGFIHLIKEGSLRERVR